MKGNLFTEMFFVRHTTTYMSEINAQSASVKKKNIYIYSYIGARKMCMHRSGYPRRRRGDIDIASRELIQIHPFAN